jgi:hypothetical protein
MSTNKERGFWFTSYPDFALVTGSGRDSLVNAGDLVISVNGRRGSNVCADLLQRVDRALEVVDAQTGAIRRVALPADSGGPGADSKTSQAYFWVLDGLYRRAVLADQIRRPGDKDAAYRKLLHLLRQRRTLARHLHDALGSSRALRAELDESQSRAAATALRLGEELAAKAAEIESLQGRIDALAADRRDLLTKLEEAHRIIDRLAKRPAASTRRVTHVKLGNELFRNLTGARA